MENRELAARVSRLEMALEAANVAYWDQDFRAGKVYRSSLWARMLGYQPEEINSSPDAWLDIIHPDERDMVISKARDHEKGVLPVFKVEHRLKTGDGNYKWILNWGKVTSRDSGGRPIRAMGIHLDIDDNKRMEEEIIRSEKMKSIGILAGGIAHDFNNLLAVMLGNVSMIRAGGIKGAKVDSLLAEIEKACVKSRDLTKELMGFTRNREVAVGSVPVGHLLKECAEFTLHGSNVICDIEVPPGTKPVRGDRSQIKRVLYNIFLNARQAMPDGGSIHAGCRNVTLKGSDNIPLEAGDYVEISIADTGAGIDPEIHNRIFDPFFSTRDRGRGIGLAASDSIIRKHNGYIMFESEPGKGSTFYVYLPVSDRKPEIAESERVDLVEGCGRVLVVDDEESIRMMAQEMLSSLGYSVDTAAGRDAALKLYRESIRDGKGYDAVIIDLTIPGEKGGQYILSDIMEFDGSVKGIVSSGYSEGDVIANFRDYGFVNSLAKPYRISELSHVLKEVIESE